MVACYACNGGSRDLDEALNDDDIKLCRYHNPMSDHNWEVDVDDPEGLIDVLCDILGDVERSEIVDKVGDTVEEYEGLVSRPSAVYLVARDYGVDLNEELAEHGIDPTHVDVEQMQNCDVNDDGFGMNGIDGEYKVRRVDDFAHGDGWIRADVIIYDETGEIELTLWNDMAEKASSLDDDDVIEIEAGYVKEDDYGRSLNIAKTGRVIWPDGSETTGPDYGDS